jgi:hypothetical protein
MAQRKSTAKRGNEEQEQAGTVVPPGKAKTVAACYYSLPPRLIAHPSIFSISNASWLVLSVLLPTTSSENKTKKQEKKKGHHPRLSLCLASIRSCWYIGWD